MSRVLGLGLKPQPHTPSTGPARPKRNAARPRLAPWHRQVKVVHGRLRILDREVGTTGAARHLAARKHQERQAKNARDIRCKGVTAEDVSTSPRCRTHPGRGDLIDQRSTCFYSTSWPLAHPILYSTKRPFAPRKQKKVNATQQQRVTQPPFHFGVCSLRTSKRQQSPLASNFTTLHEGCEGFFTLDIKSQRAFEKNPQVVSTQDI